MLKKTFRRFEKSLISLLGIILMASLLATFFAFYIPQVKWLMYASRHTAITASTFVVVGLAMLKIYGGFAIGIKKSNEITYSLSLGVAITDLVSYFQLGIMAKRFLTPLPLLWIIVVQCLLIFAFTRFGNYIFFKANPPHKALVIYGDKEGLNKFISKILIYRRQWKVNAVVDVTDEEIQRYIRSNKAVFFYNVAPNDKDRLVEYCYKHNKEIYVAPDMSDVVMNHAKHLIIDDTVIFSTSVSGLTFEQRVLKRAMDLVVSIIGIIIASPIMLIEAIAIKLEDGGPVFFKQARPTLNGRIFNVLKFRTMIVDADKGGFKPAQDGDDRITKVGRVLRKLRIDELPQLFNILIGDMSLVGPRPERVELTREYTEKYPAFRYRLKVKAGLTGLAQIKGKYNTSAKDKLILDLIYIEKYSILFDIKLLLQTLIIFVKSDSTAGFDEEFYKNLIKEKESKE